MRRFDAREGRLALVAVPDSISIKPDGTLDQAGGVNKFMAEPNQTRTVADKGPADSPVLRPGRPADPVSASPAAERMPTAPADLRPTAGKVTESGSRSGDAGSDSADAEQSRADTEEPGSAAPESDQVRAAGRQGRLRRLLRQCDRVLLLDFNTLAMSDWPDAFSVAMARRRRDLWLLALVVCGLVFASGMTGFVPPLLAGSGLGAMLLLAVSGIPAVRHLFTDAPSYFELVLYRRQLLREARLHIRNLEGRTGLIWQCPQMQEFNPALRAARFAGIIRLSEQRSLAASLTRRDHVRLCLIYLLESEKAYERLQAAYFEGHQNAIDRGWQAVATETGQEAGEQAQEQAAPTGP